MIAISIAIRVIAIVALVVVAAQLRAPIGRWREWRQVRRAQRGGIATSCGDRWRD